MKGILKITLFPMIGAIALFVACDAEPPASGDLEAEIDVADELVDELVDEVTEESEIDQGPAAGKEKKCGDCSDGDPDTLDWCDSSGECEHKDRYMCKEKYSSCSKSKDCRDGDSDTKDWCYKGSCHHADEDNGKCKKKY